MAGFQTDRIQMKDFKLGRPALVCRWRLSNGALPLENRHLRALSRRVVNGRDISPQLVAWAKQHIEWTLAEGSATHPDGVLMLVVDEMGQAAMTVGPYEALEVTTSSALAERALAGEREAERTGVSPESLWLVQNDVLVWGISRSDAPSGADSLMSDLADTMGFHVHRSEGLAASFLNGAEHCDEVFLVSDEHGIVPASNLDCDKAARFAAGYKKLLASQKSPRRH